MHNKLFIADSAVVVAGGRNIADEYFMRSMTDNFVDMDALIVGAVVPQLANIFDTYWNSPHVYPVQAIVRDGPRCRAALRREFDRLVDEGDQMMAVPLPPVDILGYGPIREDLDGGRLGLLWGKAIGVRRLARQGHGDVRRDGAQHERHDERDGPRDGGAQRGRAVVARTSCPGRWACRRSGICAAAT